MHIRQLDSQLTNCHSYYRQIPNKFVVDLSERNHTICLEAHSYTCSVLLSFVWICELVKLT